MHHRQILTLLRLLHAANNALASNCNRVGASFETFCLQSGGVWSSIKRGLLILAAAVPLFLWSSESLHVAAQTSPGDAVAADVVPAPAVPVAEAARQAIGTVVEQIGNAFSALQSNTNLSGVGNSITGWLTIIMLAWTFLMLLVEGKGLRNIFVDLVPLAMSIAIVGAFVQGGGVSGLTSFMDSIASAVAGQDVGSLKQAVFAAITKTFDAMANILSAPSPYTAGTWSSPQTWVYSGVTWLGLLVAKIICAFLVAIAGGIYVANIALAHGSMLLAAGLSYVMVPWLICPATTWIFDSWLRFTIGAGMIKVVGTFMLFFTDKLMAGLAQLSTKVQLPENADWATVSTTMILVLAGMVLLSGLCAYMMMQVPQIAAGMISGSAGGAGFRGIRALTGGVGMQFGKSASISGSRGTAAAAGSIGGASRAWSDARSASNAGVKREPMKTAREKYGTVGARVYNGAGGRTVGAVPGATKP